MQDCNERKAQPHIALICGRSVRLNALQSMPEKCHKVSNTSWKMLCPCECEQNSCFCGQHRLWGLVFLSRELRRDPRGR